MRPSRSIAALALCGALTFTVAACGSSDSSSSTSSGGSSASTDSGSSSGGSLSGSIAGAGSSAQAAAQQAWTAGFQQSNPDATVSYDPVGSGGGREQFVAGGTDFGGSDAALEGDELAGAAKRCGGEDKLIEVPVYVSPIAVVYNLSGVDKLQLSPDTLAKIFKGEITSWDDAAIKSDNPDADLPSTRITVVHRSDESGTTENFTDYLSQVAPSIWSYDVSGDWPIKGGEAADGTSGVIAAVKNGDGAIGYADESQAGDLGKADVGVGSEFVGPSAEAAAKIFADSKRVEEGGANVFAYQLNRKTESSGTYPIVLVSYEMACTDYSDANKAALVHGYLNYMISADGQSAAQQAAGSAPLSDDVRSQIQPSIDKIGAGS